jgi:release factor glutamine methyltransferase
VGVVNETRHRLGNPDVADLVTRLRAAGCVFAEDEAALLLETADTAERLADLTDRRIAGEPLEHVLGWAQFHGLRVKVGPGVFVPRHRSSLLVDAACAAGRDLRATRPDDVPLVVLDLCCGCGALGLATAHTLDGDADAPPAGVELHAADVEPAAVACARDNLAPVGGTVHQGDLYDPLPADLAGRVDLLLANVPYVPTEAIALMPPEARDHEPRRALDGGADGLLVLRRVAAAAPRWLAPGGRLFSELGDSQVDAAVAVLADAGLEPRPVRTEEGTVIVGTRR